MRREVKWTVAVVVAFAVGVLGAGAYARLAAPYYLWVTRSVATAFPWKISSVAVVQDKDGHGTVLRLTSEVREYRLDTQPAALVISSVHVGEVIETPIVFWTLLALWPVETVRRRVLLLLAAIPVFLALEAVTTGCQLLHPLAEASARIAGEHNPLTGWERWSRLLESGGRFVLEVGAALLVVTLTRLATVFGSRSPSAAKPEPRMTIGA